MLVLTRRAGERLVIGGDVVITVIEVRSDGVRIGIDAPRHIRVHRAEVLEAVSSANAAAAASPAQVGDALRDLVGGAAAGPGHDQPAGGRPAGDPPTGDQPGDRPA